MLTPQQVKDLRDYGNSKGYDPKKIEAFIQSKQSIIQPQKSSSSFGQRLKQAATEGINKIKSSSKDINSGNPINFAEGAIKAGAGIIDTAFSPVSAATEPIIKPTLGRAVNFAADKISNNSSVQKFANSKAGQITSRVAEDVNNLNTIAGAVVGSKTVGKLGSKFTGAASEIGTFAGKARGVESPTVNAFKTAVKDVSPTYEHIINDQIVKAFDLTQNDVKNILSSTGNHVGDFVAKHNLIGDTVESSQKLLQDFYQKNYKTVRSEINKVTTEYKPSSIPRYTEALKELQKKITDVPGLQKVSNQVNQLLDKKTIKLADIQTAKELMDDHFSLYKVTGDVGEGIAKKGLNNIRKDLRGFIEKEVKNNNGKDIFDLNNKVSTSQSILGAIEDRTTRASTRQKITLSDLSLFGSGSLAGSPFVGIGLVFAKKILESPSVRLRIANYLKTLSAAKRAKIQATMAAGKIPAELGKFVK